VQPYSETPLNPRTIQRDDVICSCLNVKYYFSRLLTQLEYSRHIAVKFTSIIHENHFGLESSLCMWIRQKTDRQINRHDKRNVRFSQLCDGACLKKNCSGI